MNALPHSPAEYVSCEMAVIIYNQNGDWLLERVSMEMYMAWYRISCSRFFIYALAFTRLYPWVNKFGAVLLGSREPPSGT